MNHLPLRLAYRIAGVLSDIHYCFSFRDKRAVKSNLQVILGSEKNMSFLAREVFRNFGRYLVEFFRMKTTLDTEYIKKNIQTINVDRLHQVLEKKKGGILLTAHIGNWEMGAAVMSLLGYPVVAIALPHKERPVNDLFNTQREACGIAVIPTNVAVRRSLEALKENKFIALVADRDFNANGLEMDFLGKKALIPRGAVVFSVKTGAPIIPCFLIRNPDDSFTLELDDIIFPLEVMEDNVPEETMLTVMQQYIAVIEKKIRQYPTQWLMFRKFWIK